MTHQEQFNSTHIKLAKVTKNVQKALNIIILDKSDGIYMDDDQINALAKQYPESYLSRMEWLSNILKRPDFVGKSEEGRRIVYVKEFYNTTTKKFCKVVISVIKNFDHRQIEWWQTSNGEGIGHGCSNVDLFYRV